MMYDKVLSSYLRTCLKGLWVTLLRSPPPPAAFLTKKSCMRPQKYVYVFLKYSLKTLSVCFFLYLCKWLFPRPTLPWQGDDICFLVSLTSRVTSLFEMVLFIDNFRHCYTHSRIRRAYNLSAIYNDDVLYMIMAGRGRNRTNYFVLTASVHITVNFIFRFNSFFFVFTKFDFNFIIVFSHSYFTFQF